MNGIKKDSFLAAEDSRVRDGMLYDMLEGIYNQVSFKRTVLVAFLGGTAAVLLMQSPVLLALLVKMIL